MSGGGIGLVIRNRQRRWRVDLRLLRSVAGTLLGDLLGLRGGELGIELIGARRMAALNWRWLRHEGSTDILTFDHRENGTGPLQGELAISVEDAVRQAEEFGVGPGAELVRYVVHGVLHLSGYDDLEPTARRRMKREEGRLLRSLERRFPLHRLMETPGSAGLGKVAHPIRSKPKNRDRARE